MFFCFCLILKLYSKLIFCAAVLHHTKLFMGEGSGLKNVHEKFNQNIYGKKIKFAQINSVEFWRLVLTGLERHDALQAGELCGVQAHLPEPGHHLLQRLDLGHDLGHPLGLCVFAVHSCEKRRGVSGRPSRDFNASGGSSTLEVGPPVSLLTRNGQEGGGVHRDGPLGDTQNKQLSPGVLQENQLQRVKQSGLSMAF